MNTMSNPQCQGNDWIDALELPPPHTVEYEPHKRRAQWTAEQMRAFARKAVAESEARRQGEAVAILTAPPHHLELTSEGFDLPDGEYKLFTHPQPLPAPSPEVAEYLADLIPNTAVVIEQDGKPIGVRMTYAEVKLFAQALATTPPAPANSEAIPAPVAPECRMLTKEEVFSVVRDSFVAKLSHYECLQLKFCEVNGLKLAANGGAKI
jgi:hypothetical protein